MLMAFLPCNIILSTVHKAPMILTSPPGEWTTQTHPVHNFLKSIFCLNLIFKVSYLISNNFMIGFPSQLLIILSNFAKLSLFAQSVLALPLMYCHP